MTEPPIVVASVVDTRDERLARVHAVRNRRLYLCLPGGVAADEWEAVPQHVRHTARGRGCRGVGTRAVHPAAPDHRAVGPTGRHQPLPGRRAGGPTGLAVRG